MGGKQPGKKKRGPGAQERVRDIPTLTVWSLTINTQAEKQNM